MKVKRQPCKAIHNPDVVCYVCRDIVQRKLFSAGQQADHYCIGAGCTFCMNKQAHESQAEVRETIKLFLSDGVWMAQSNDKRIRDLFDTDTLPTAFTSYTSPENILIEIRALNPNAIVELVPTPRGWSEVQGELSCWDIDFDHTNCAASPCVACKPEVQS